MELFSPPSMRALPYSQDVGTRRWIDSQLFAAIEAQNPVDDQINKLVSDLFAFSSDQDNAFGAAEQDLPGYRSGGADVFPVIAKTPLSKEHGLLISRPSFG